MSSDHFHDILFELSNQDRYSILQTLKTQSYNVTNLAKLLNLTTQETSRHLTRLTATNLIEKTISGEYILTGYGTLILDQLLGTLFVTSNNEYFANHFTTHMPSEYISRLNELENSHLESDVMVVFANIERIIDEAEEYIWRLTDRYNMMALPKLEEATERGVTFRLMQTRYFQYPPDWPGQGIVLREARLSEKFYVRTSNEANLFIAMNEEEVAVLAFPMDKNVFDYRGFSSKDPLFHKWCRDIFEHYWAEASPVS
jgi:predicted transcriptional regulator